MSRVRDLVKQFSGRGGLSTPSEEETKRQNAVLSNSQPTTPTTPTTPTSPMNVAEEAPVVPDEGAKKKVSTVAAGLSFHEEMLRKQRLAKEEERARAKEHREQTSKPTSSLSMLEMGAMLGKKQKEEERLAREDAANYASGFRGYGDKFQDELRLREQKTKELDRKAREEIEQAKRSHKGLGEVSLIDSASTLERQRKAAEQKAKEEVENLQKTYKGNVTFMDEARKSEQMQRDKDRKAREDAAMRAATYRGSASKFDDEVAKLEKERREMDKKAMQEIEDLKSKYKGSGSISLLDQAAELERKRKEEDAKAKAEIEALKANFKGHLGLLDQAALDDKKLRELEKLAVQDAKALQAKFRGVVLGKEAANVESSTTGVVEGASTPNLVSSSATGEVEEPSTPELVNSSDPIQEDNPSAEETGFEELDSAPALEESLDKDEQEPESHEAEKDEQPVQVEEEEDSAKSDNAVTNETNVLPVEKSEPEFNSTDVTGGVEDEVINDDVPPLVETTEVVDETKALSQITEIAEEVVGQEVEVVKTEIDQDDVGAVSQDTEASKVSDEVNASTQPLLATDEPQAHSPISSA